MGRGLAGAQAVQIAEQEKRLREAQANEYAARSERARQEQAQQSAAAQRDQQFAQALQSGAKPAELARYFPEKVDLLKKLADAPNFGRQAVARTIDVELPGGGKGVRQLDQFGNPVTDDMQGYVAPQLINQGNKQTFAKPVAGQSFDIGMSPSERDASARGWASNSLARERLEMDKQGGAEGGKPVWNSELGGFVDPKTRVVMPALDSTGNPIASPKTGTAGAKIQDAKDVLSILDMAEPILKKSTGSYLGAGIDAGAQAFGISTTGAKAAAELKALQGALVSKMPKMSGPQSDKDVQLYREMAGQIGDPTIPVATRQAAIETIRVLNEKYAGQQGMEAKPKANVSSIPPKAIAELKMRGPSAKAQFDAAFGVGAADAVLGGQ